MDLPIYVKKYEEDFVLTNAMKKAFDVDGFILIRKLFTEDEISKVKSSVDDPSSALMSHAYGHGPGGDVGKVKMIRWNQPGDDVTGLMARSRRVVDTSEKLLEGEVFHYHTRLIIKEAFTGGTFQWHQDYGYWYPNGILAPNMLSVMISIDEANEANGCLQVIRGSHKLGRVDHTKDNNGAGADKERVEQILRRFEKIYIETQPGDVLFFHCNLLHRSDNNKSAHRRANLTLCYNRFDNDAFREHHHSSYVPIEKVEDSSVTNCNNHDLSGKGFYVPKQKFGQKLEMKNDYSH